MSSVRRLAQNVISALVRPYVHHELPGWGKIYGLAIGGPARDWLWANPAERVIREKITGRLVRLDISRWPDRSLYFLGRWYSLETQLLIERFIRPGDTVVDVGANRGLFAFAAAHRAGRRGRVLAFEPNLASVRSMEREAAENAISTVAIFPFGLGAQNEFRDLFVCYNNSGGATFGIPNADPSSVFRVPAEIRIGDEMLGGTVPAFIKIDVEGYECRVISGLKRTIKTHGPVILMEALQENLEICGTTLDELLGLMRGLGYEPFDIGLRRKWLRHVLRIRQLNGKPRGTDILWLPSASACSFS